MIFSENHRLSAKIFLVVFCLTPLLGVFAPRAMAFLPALAAVAGCLAGQGRPKFNSAALGWISALVVLIAVGSFWALDSNLVWDRILRSAPIFYGGILLIAVVQIMPQNIIPDFKRLFAFSVIVSGIFCAFELLARGYLHSVIHEISDEERAQSIAFLNRGVIICCLSMIVIFFMDYPRRLKYLVGLLLGLILIFTESQSVQLAMAIAGIAFFLPVTRRPLWIALAGFTSVLLITAPFLAQWIFQDAASTLDQYEILREGYAANRTEIWDFVARRVMERPILGHGIEATRVIEDFDVHKIYFKDSTVLHPHNFALQIWIEFGLVGVLYFCAFLSFLYYQIWVLSKKSVPAARFCLVVLLACVCMAATSYGFWQSWWLGLFTYVAGLCFIMQKALNRETGIQ